MGRPGPRSARGELAIAEHAAGDVSGHGTACAGIIRALAPGCSITSVRVLGPDLAGTAAESWSSRPYRPSGDRL